MVADCSTGDSAGAVNSVILSLAFLGFKVLITQPIIIIIVIISESTVPLLCSSEARSSDTITVGSFTHLFHVVFQQVRRRFAAAAAATAGVPPVVPH